MEFNEGINEMNDNDMELLNKNLEILKGHKLQMKYNGKILLEKVDPTAEEILEALYNQP